MKQLLEALNKVMGDVGYVQKGSKNTFHNYKYASEEDLLLVLRPALVKHGLLLIPSLDGGVSMDDHGNSNLVMDYSLAHTSGEIWPKPIRIPGCGNDKNSKGGIGDKGTYKALTGANKYLLFKLYQIATGDDPEVASAADIAPEEKPKARQAEQSKGNPKAEPDRMPESDEEFLEDWIVPVPVKNKKLDWSTWVSEVEDKFIRADTGRQVDLIVEANADNLFKLRDELSPSMFEHLKDAAQTRRVQLQGATV